MVSKQNRPSKYIATSARAIEIEAKTSVLQEKQRVHGAIFQITEYGCSVTRSILVPHSAIPWMSNVLLNSIENQQISVPVWRHKGFTKMKAVILRNHTGRFLSIMEFLSDRRSFTICIPEGRDDSSWSRFEKELLSQILKQNEPTKSN